ncbi:MAG: VCBS domain-containing protein [Rhodoferax sp.]|nr:VCBS domain-containing protein [Rhodoferax sp.]
MGTMTFQINDRSTDGSGPATWVTVVENPDGTLGVRVAVEGALLGDLRGVFFDISNEALIGTLKLSEASAGLTEFRQGNDTIKDLGDGANMNGMLGSDNGYDLGIEIGSSGIGKDDYRAFSFTLGSSARALTLQDLSQSDFGVRLTSVGTDGSARTASAKMLETTSNAVSALADVVLAFEDTPATGNLLTNDLTGLRVGELTTLTDWNGAAPGSTQSLDAAAGATLTVHADGSYVLDTTAADALSAGETLTYSFTYGVKSQSQATSWSTDSATFTVTVKGTNDGPVAADDLGEQILENASTSGNVLVNDSDVDRLDTLVVSTIEGANLGAPVTLESGATVTMQADGSYVYDTNGAFDGLNSGDTATDSFEYTISDGQGGLATATVRITISGVSTPDTPPPLPPDTTDLFPAMAQNISNVVLYLDDGDATTAIQKIKLSPDGLQLKDVDLLNIDAFIASHHTLLGGNTNLVGLSIHAGNEYKDLAGTDMTAHGEGVFYLLGDPTPIDAVGSRAGGGWSYDWTVDDVPLSDAALALGFSYELLAQQAPVVFTDFQNGLWG